MAGAGTRKFPASQAMVRRARKAPRGAERMRGDGRASASRAARQGVVADVVRRQAVREALGRSCGAPYLVRTADIDAATCHSSPGRPGLRASEKLRLVRTNLLANTWSGEPGHPGEKRGPVGKSQFCHDIE